ncbi:ABC transporter permease [Rhizobium leguminosarum]|uniref:ABC transporter permease n=1 Tax=Rhizobium leguminosarum TaxID=384 RepID=UPI001C9273DD|nr:ABC transporter permease [Rhizobium leguminosarum]MBY2924191.1 ABC transporter permease [Rhizobium leguminosarum]MBY2985586.1 ABC transporter permease [Rhizobium leguminosarum]MBY3025325.1 ABC transporter permease [Rhizobium leguminosarum]
MPQTATPLTADTNDSRQSRRWRELSFVRPLLKWLWSFALTLFGLALVTFTMTRLSPIDPALQLVGDHASQSTYEAARVELGLDQPLPVQFVRYLETALSGNFGQSISTGQPVAKDIARTFPATIELATAAIILGAAIGLALGIAAAMRQGTWVDSAARFVSLFGYSVPIFWLGLLMLLLFYARLHWAPGPGRADVVFQYTVKPISGFALIDTWMSGKTGAFRDALAHLALPAIVLAFHALAAISRLTRAAILTELGQEYVTTARAKGASLRRITFIHIMPNIAGTLLTLIALSYASLLEGAVLTETVFAWPGIGRYLTTAMFAGDMPAILGATLVVGASFVLLNALTDLGVSRLDAGRRR